MRTSVEATLQASLNREVTTLLRRRFIWLCAGWLFVLLLPYARAIFTDETEPLARFLSQPAVLFGELGRLSMLVMSMWLAVQVYRRERQLLHLAFWLVMVMAAMNLTMVAGAREVDSLRGHAIASSISNALLYIAAGHFLTCLLLPWSTRQAIAPLVAIYPAWIVLSFLGPDPDIGAMVANLVLALFMGAVGIMLCNYRLGRLRGRYELDTLRTRFLSARRELIDARKIHQARFPVPVMEGPIQFEYAYEPMRQIGGDFLYVVPGPDGSLNVAVIDVTGHGIAAALAVNRIDGELQRVFAENPETSPVDAATLLNRYMYLTLSRHGIFATAFLLRIEPSGRVEWVNCGHPPGFVCRHGGVQDRLDSSAMMLGAADDDIFDAERNETTVAPGETVVVYTDGVCEAKNERNRQFGLRGLERTLRRWNAPPSSNGAKTHDAEDASSSSPRISLTELIPETVRHFRDGPADDDVLITVLRIAPNE